MQSAGSVPVATSALRDHVSSADVHQLVVHVDVGALRAEPGDGAECRLENGTPLPVGLARKLACDGSIVRVLEHDGKVLSVGRKTRTIPPALRRALKIRDKCCQFPGCCQARHVDGHHLVLDHEHVGVGERGAHLARPRREVGGGLVQKERDHVAGEDAELLRVRCSIPQPRQAVRHERMPANGERHSYLL